MVVRTQAERRIRFVSSSRDTNKLKAATLDTVAALLMGVRPRGVFFPPLDKTSNKQRFPSLSQCPNPFFFYLFFGCVCQRVCFVLCVNFLCDSQRLAPFSSCSLSLSCFSSSPFSYDLQRLEYPFLILHLLVLILSSPSSHLFGLVSSVLLCQRSVGRREGFRGLEATSGIISASSPLSLLITFCLFLPSPLYSGWLLRFCYLGG